jgi:hypothetical protein
MTSVSSISQSRPADTERASHRRIRKMSRLLSIAITILLVLAVLMPLALAFAATVMPDKMGCNAHGCELEFDRPLPKGFIPISTWPMMTRLAGGADLAIATLAPFFMLFNLRRLFRLYAKGSVFARENADTIRLIGLWLLLYLPLKFLSNWVFVAAGGMDHAWLHATGIYAFILGAIVVFIAQVMELGHEIEKEHGEFV